MEHSERLSRAQFDKLSAASHEAGHVVVAAILGEDVRAWLVETHTTDPDNERFWTGKADYLHWTLTPAVAVAGCAAEILDDNEDACAMECVDYVSADVSELSETDAAGYPKEYGEQLAAFEQALAILRANPKFWKWATYELFNNEVITNGMVSDWMKENDCTSPET
jgi:hypothetical protein